MLCARALFVALVLGVAVAGCRSAMPVGALRTAPVDVATPTSQSATVMFTGLSAAPEARRLLAVATTNKLKITIRAPAPFTTVEKTIDFAPDSPTPPSLSDLQVGTRRHFLAQFLDDQGKVLDGARYSTVIDLNPGPNTCEFNDVGTVTGDVFGDLLTRFPDQAMVVDIDLIKQVIADTIATTKAASPRLLNVQKIAERVREATTKETITPAPDWVQKAGYIQVGFLDSIPGVKVRVTVDDQLSAPAISIAGESVFVGPIAPRTEAYTVRIRPVLDVLPPDLQEQTFPAQIVDANNVTRFPSNSFSKTTAGVALPDRVGGGGFTQVGDALWLLGGLVQPDSAPAGATGEPRAETAETAYRFQRGSGWTKPIALPATFPTYGGAVAVDGTKIYVFGGLRNALGSDQVYMLDTATTNEAAPLVNPMTISPALYPAAPTVSLAEASAAKLGGKIFVAGGRTNIPGFPNIAPEPWENMLSFDPTTGTFDQNPPPGLPEADLRVSMAGGVIGGKWYLAGGHANPDFPKRTLSIFDGTTWSTGADMPTPRTLAGAIVVQNKLWVIGGEEEKGQPSRAVEVYDPETDRWQHRAPLKVGRALPGLALINAADSTPRIVVAGGSYGMLDKELGLPLPKNTVEEIKP